MSLSLGQQDHGEMRQGKASFDSFRTADGFRFLAYAPVGGTDGWSVALTAPKMDYLVNTYYGIAIIVLAIIASVAASIVGSREAVPQYQQYHRHH